MYVDDRLKTPRWRGRPPRLTDAELVTLSVAQAVLGFHCEARWLRFAHAHLHGLFPYLPQRPACNKHLRAALPLVKQAIRSLAADTDLWLDPLWIVDSSPVECARPRGTVRRSDLVGWANYGYCHAPSRFYWPQRPGRGPETAPGVHPGRAARHSGGADPEVDERQVLAPLIDNEPEPAIARPCLLVLAGTRSGSSPRRAGGT